MRVGLERGENSATANAVPDFLRQVLQFSNTVHFSDGHLSRRHKEMIASHVSYLKPVPVLTGQHAYFLRVQGATDLMCTGNHRRQARRSGPDTRGACVA